MQEDLNYNMFVPDVYIRNHLYPDINRFSCHKNARNLIDGEDVFNAATMVNNW